MPNQNQPNFNIDTQLTYIESLQSKIKYGELSPTEILKIKAEMKTKIHIELDKIFASQCSFEQALANMRQSQTLSDLFELYKAQKELVEEDQSFVEFDKDFNPDLNSVPTILCNLRKAIFEEIDCLQGETLMNPFIFNLKINQIVEAGKSFEENFPTVVEWIKYLRDKSIILPVKNENGEFEKASFEPDKVDFESLKVSMIKAVEARFEKKIELFNSILDIPGISNYNGAVKELINQISGKDDNGKVIDKQFRALCSRINIKKLTGSEEERLQELISIFGDSFSLRDFIPIFNAKLCSIKERRKALQIKIEKGEKFGIKESFSLSNIMILNEFLEEVLDAIKNISFTPPANYPIIPSINLTNYEPQPSFSKEDFKNFVFGK